MLVSLLPLLSCALPQDFNGDAYQDLAVGVPYEDIDDVLFDTGAVTVVYGGPGQPAFPGVQHWTQDTAGVLGDAARTDDFGFALSYGDYNGDGYDDLAVGIPSDELPGLVGAGSIQVLYGSPGGLAAAGSQLWTQDAPGLGSAAESYDAFGGVLASGDFNGDGRADLAIGLPYEDEGSLYDAGAVQVLYGGPGGLSAAASQYWTQDSPGIPGHAETPDRFGWALGAGDFNRDGFLDLAIGVRYEGVGSALAAGAVHVLYGGASGLAAAGNQLWHQESPGVPGDAAEYEYFGSALAAGDFNGDGAADLAVGATADRVGIHAAGGVSVLHGGVAGLSALGSQLWNQDSPGLRDLAEGADGFGGALAAGDFDGNGWEDLAIGAPGEGLGVRFSVGAVTVLFGRSSGLDAAGSRFLHQNLPRVPDSGDNHDSFGHALAALDLDGDGLDDLAVGAPGEKLTHVQQGTVTLIFGGARPFRRLSQATPGIPGDPDSGNSFGFSFPR
ncbi:MAG: hypothetical protein EYC70_12430 [Planctomycetota bacterium]|nr:MAG: hypothetical protein EYC70_12430 [Planctomycetota bacterium]